MVTRRRSSSLPDDERFDEFLRELAEHSKAVIEFQADLKYLRENLGPIFKLFEGDNGKESLPTRVRLLEDACKRLQTEVRAASNENIEKRISELNAYVTKEITGIRNIMDTFKINCTYDHTSLNGWRTTIDNSIQKHNDFIDTQKASWQGYIIGIAKWVGAIISAYVLFKLTGT